MKTVNILATKWINRKMNLPTEKDGDLNGKIYVYSHMAVIIMHYKEFIEQKILTHWAKIELINE